MQRLSSSFTPVFKVAFPLVFAGMASFALGRVIQTQADQPTSVIAAVLVLVCIAFALRWLTQFKRVHFDGSELIVSNYLRAARIPVAAIERVTQNRVINLRPITVVFSGDTPFGRWIRFMPRVSFRLFAEDDIVGQLRELARAHRR